MTFYPEFTNAIDKTRECMHTGLVGVLDLIVDYPDVYFFFFCGGLFCKKENFNPELASDALLINGN